MTIKLFHLDSYLREFDATVTGVDADQNAVVLDQTAFYPGGGGQPPDIGLLSGKNVLRARSAAGEIYHVMEGPVPVLDEQVHGVLDWEHRYKLMRTHTAMHILCGVVFRDYGALVTGGEMEALKGRMDFEFARLEGRLVAEIELAVNREIEASRDVRIRILPRAEAFLIPDLIRTKINLLPAGIEEVRTVEIVGLDLQADGGTHVANTSEVGRIRVADYKSKGAINKRIYIEVNDR
jgi:misacylated tRNA(Ala) deacylase